VQRAAIITLAALAFCLCSCGTTKRLIVNVDQQRIALFDKEEFVAAYPVSTSKFGLGDTPGSNKTPLGTMKVAKKIGGGSKSGTVFKSRVPTGEVLRPNAPGRDPIITRILWLRGTERNNRNAFPRYIYIHGTPVERNIGRPASYGCIRMRSRDIIDLYSRIPKGTPVTVVRG
jgi:lipoprotein-anchoring transpeptidase ErfK/SrfK